MKSIYENATPRPWEVVPATIHHGPYIVSEFGNSLADLYTMTYPGEPSTASGGRSEPMPFMAEMADPNAALIVHAVNNVERLEAINASLIDQVSELSTAPWPKWAESLLSILRDWTGPCPEDAVEGVDLPEELRIWLEGYRDELERVAHAKEGEAGNGAS